MKEIRLPIVVTTMEGLANCVTDRWSAIYVDFTLYLRYRYQIEEMLCEHGFVFSHKGRNGLFYLKTEGEDAFDPNIHEIHDPFRIL